MQGGAIGIQVGATTSPAELGAIAAEAEQLGFSEMWLAEDYFDLGGIASAAAALAVTDEIRVGLGVVAAPARHPAVLAMEFATLGGAYSGRFMAGIGHGSPHWVQQMGLDTETPLSLLREATSTVRRLLDGDEVTAEGSFFRFDRVRLSHVPPARVPLYLGVHGPASLRASGELADGTLLGWFSSPGYVRWARERIDEGRARAGRTDRHELVSLCLLSVSENDPDAARDALGKWAAPMLAAMAESPQLTVSSVGSDLLEWIDGDRLGESALPGDLLNKFAAAGDRADCSTMIARLLESGADRVVLVPNPAGFRSTSDMANQMRLAAPLLTNLRRGVEDRTPTASN